MANTLVTIVNYLFLAAVGLAMLAFMWSPSRQMARFSLLTLVIATSVFALAHAV